MQGGMRIEGGSRQGGRMVDAGWNEDRLRVKGGSRQGGRSVVSEPAQICPLKVFPLRGLVARPGSHES